MLVFRTVLLWIAFVLLIVLEFPNSLEQHFGIGFRLLPSIFLVLWFLVYLLVRERHVIRKDTSKKKVMLLRVFRSVANVAIIFGAVFKMMHYPYSQLLLITGIGCLAIWSSLFSAFALEKSQYNPEIIDDHQDESTEE